MLNYISRLVGAVVFFSLLIGEVSAEPFRPQNSAAVLEKLPLKPGDSQWRELRQLRAELAAQPNNVAVATKLARRYFDLVSAEGDPRYVGYAQAALAPWWTQSSPPVDVLVLRATLKQYRHDFSSALADLDGAIAQNSRNPEALSLAATIHMVQGRYGEARSKCDALRKLTTEVIAIGCFSMLDALEGRAKEAYDHLQAALARASDASPGQRLWVLTRLGEIAARLGDYGAAEKHYREGLALGLVDGYLLAAYADLLLDQNRPAEVLTLLKGMNRSDLLLLRMGLAAKVLAAPDAEKYRTELANRFEAGKMRGDKVHQAEEARFKLSIMNDPQAALLLAKENWTVQKEARDARVLLESAIATKDRTSAEPVLTWLKETKMEDIILRKLAKQLEG
ncbi:MAG: hypothetical protein V4568_12370 [Pseudomonadota bacterium]